jgi:hypothetical protein
MRQAVFKIGLNQQFIGKPDKTVAVNYAVAWKPSEVTEANLIAHIRQGFAFTAQFRDGYRKTANFICSDFVAADFDDTLTLEEAKASPFIQQHCAFLYTTPSHTADHHRFRAVFLLDDTITEAKVWADCLYGLAIRLGSDRSIKDAGRMFFGSLDAEMIEIGGRLPVAEVDKLVTLAQDERSRSRHPSAAGAAISSSLKLRSDQLVRLNNGTMAELGTVAPYTSVACPYHADEHPSAFVVRSNQRANGIHCMACNATFWTRSGDPYDFTAFDRLVEERKAVDTADIQAVEQHDNPFVALFPPDPHVFVYQSQFLPSLDYRAGITVIKSPKGSGKTEALSAMVEQIRQVRFFSSIAKAERPKSILLIGHRQSLIKEAANRLGLDCYLDDEDKGTHRKKRFGYAICLDSLHKIAMGASKGSSPSQYDVIILDESEQVISHLLSETLRERIGMPAAFACLEFMIRRAKAVYALDADLGLITLHALKDLRPADWEKSLRVVQNKPQAVTDRRTMQVYQSKKDLQHRMLDAIREGKRCFIASNSKATVEVLEELLRKEFGSSLKMVAITSENSRGKFETRFVQNIQTEFLKVQVLICSPSLGTGIDISFPDGRCEVDEVIGFFSPHVNKHTDIDQQLARVRNPGNVSVWFDVGTANYETSLDVIRRQLALASYVPTALNGRLDEHGNQSFDDANPLLNIAAHVMVAQRSSQNKIVALFQKLRQSNGWDIERVEKTQKMASDSKWKDAQLERKERRIAGILTARELSDSEFVELDDNSKKGQNLLKADRYAVEKCELKKIYNRPVDRQLIEMDRNGALRDQLKIYNKIFGKNNDFSVMFDNIAFMPQSGKQIPKNPKWVFIAIIIKVSGISSDDHISITKVTRAHELEDFKNFLIHNRVTIEDVFSSPLRSDYMINPVRQLNYFIGLAGLKLVADKRVQKSRVSNVNYVVDQSSLSLMNDLIKIKSG